MIPARLVDLLDDVEVETMNPTAPTAVVANITQDSAQVGPGVLFCCRRGHEVDGHRYAPDAVERGASALLVERLLRLPVAQVVVADVSRALPRVAAAGWGHPSRRLHLIGVTGTNGKTTTTYLIRSILEAAGLRTRVIGTLNGPLTTPEPVDLQRRLAGMVAEGTQAAAMEVSSHGLIQHRVDATSFAVGVFTNLDRDHLDYHGDMDSYFRAKASLFQLGRVSVGVVNADDPWGRRLLHSPNLPTVPYSTADLHPITTSGGSTFHWRGETVNLRLPGRFNVDNALAAATVAEALGVPPNITSEALSTVVGPPGRMESIETGQPFRVIVDCAHTPTALRQVVSTLRSGGSGRLIVVFGCGGDRDRTKRPEMGATVADHADLGILTTDNPRNEPLAQIFADVLSGTGATSLVVEPDRRSAIAQAIKAAGDGDTVLVAGKGDQTIQQIGDSSIPFDDRNVAREELELLRTICPALSE